MMAQCPFAQWDPVSGTTTGGSYISGPFKIVHHTTEGSSYEGAVEAYRDHNSPPHFTVDSTTIYQHIDTSDAARALKNPPGGVHTNRDSAIQIEVVGFAGRPKNPQTLGNVARLCRWIEETHEVPRVWPNGLPRPPRDGRDPGSHNRNAVNWDSLGGHYGHCHVPENTHWDPAYTAEEAAFLMLDADSDSRHLERALAVSFSQNAEAGEAEVRSESGPVLALGERVPAQSEAATVGPFLSRIPRGSPKLVKNVNPNIVFSNDEANDDDRFMTPRLKENTDSLAILVMQEWPGVKLRVIDAWDEGQGHASTSRHYEGRAVDLTTFPKDRSKLGRLCSLAVRAGYDWVFYENDQHIHASVLRDEDLHEALAEVARDVVSEEEQQDLVTRLRINVGRLEEEERQLETISIQLPPDGQERLCEIGDSISRLEAAISLLAPLFKR
jgi:hedgehog signaling domain-containing protein/N-acetylmuramoyl-L-alanine amidase-like protein